MPAPAVRPKRKSTKPIEAFRFDKNERTSYHGAAAGHFDPGRMAEKVLGKGVNFGELMAYCFRRFGPPNIGSDDYKDICCWLLTTPMKGVLLSVRLIPHETNLLFGYMLAASVETAVRAEDLVEWRERQERFRRWVRKTTGEDPPLWGYDEAMFSGKPVSPECGSEEYRKLKARRKELYAQFYATPAAKRPLRSKRVFAPQIEDALRLALRDLKRPVPVRDVNINALGRCETSRGAVPHFAAAGNCTPLWFWDDPEAACSLFGLIDKLGGVAAVVEKLGRLAPNENTVPNTEPSR